MGVWTGRASLLINVFHIARRLAFDFQWKSVEAQVGAREWHGVHFELLLLRSAADQNIVPIDLKVSPEADAARAGRQFAGQVSGHSARTAGRESHVVHHP